MKRNRALKLMMVTLGAGLLLSFCLSSGSVVVVVAVVLILLGLLVSC
ncbi:hypothetical protein [Neobittarella massiliensis]|uniref:Uncharacterized protein n=1 Tax=Neobittarella massiliensis (ex Bilen et al. 2018) TaxID=2041842 RepID=A0A8J6IP61_9FIRM|nr:hypothetical protein [Neobittarella massiliensis]MBC3515571.1 hypothetical protein [Neobittarella massiliensis]